MQDDLATIWDRASAELRESVPPSTYEIWLAAVRPIAVADSRLYLRAPDKVRAWVERRYTSLISRAVARHLPALRGISFVSGDTLPAGVVQPSPATSGRRRRNLNPRYTFDRFVIGEGNRFAHAAALAVAELPGHAYNPLFLYGDPGLGKTHLLGAIGNYVSAHSLDLTVVYTTAETFTNEFVHALHRREVDAFKDRYRAVDVLLIDDVQFLENKRRTEEEFFHTFNCLHEGGSQLVLSSDRSPENLSDLAQRLRDRFEWGLLADMASPDPQTRLTVLRRRVAEDELDVPSEALEEIATTVTANIRQLEGALTRVLAYASLTNRSVDRSLVRMVLAGTAAPPTLATTVEQIQSAICTRLGIDPAKLTGSDRSGATVLGRQVAMYLCRELTDHSLPRIGREFGGRDHSTVLHSIRRVTERIGSDREAYELVHSLLTELGTSAGPSPS